MLKTNTKTNMEFYNFKKIDLVKDLNTVNVNPGNPNYKTHIEEWIFRNIFNEQNLTCSQSKNVNEFIENFNQFCQEKWLEVKSNFRRFVTKNKNLNEKLPDFISNSTETCLGCEKCMVKVIATEVKVSSGSEEVYVTSAKSLPYLENTNIEEFADVVIKSENNVDVFINQLLLLSWSNLSKDLLQNNFLNGLDSVISTNLSDSDLKILHDFVMKGVLPCSENDILTDKLSNDINNIFMVFGINLKLAVSGITNHEDTILPDWNEQLLNEDEVISVTETKVLEELPTFISESIRNVELPQHPVVPYIPKLVPKPKIPKRKKINFQLEVAPKKIKNELNDDEEEFEPSVFIKVKEAIIEDNKLDLDINEENNKLRRGVHERKPKKNHYTFVSYKKMVECQKKYENVFIIQIPPPDFTEEEFSKFEFPQHVYKHVYRQVEAEKISNVELEPGTNVCKECKKEFPDLKKLQLHFRKEHTIHYVCPYENCGFKVKKMESRSAKFGFARHLYFHEHEHPQLSYPHECIGNFVINSTLHNA